MEIEDVAVIVPVYNAENTILRCLKSIESQTYNKITIYIINNLSTDKSQEIIDQFISKATIRTHTLNCYQKGVAFARNVGIAQSKSQYICFLDSDDELTPTSIAERVATLKDRPECGFTYGDYTVKSIDGYTYTKVAPRFISTSNIYTRNHIGNLTGMYDTVRMGKVFQKPIGHEDYQMWIDVFKRSNCGCKTESKSLGIYNKSSVSLSANKIEAAIWHLNILKLNVPNKLLVYYYFLKYVFYHIVRRLKE